MGATPNSQNKLIWPQLSTAPYSFSATQAHAQDFSPGGGEFKIKCLCAREARKIFFAPPLRNFRPPSGGGRDFPRGGRKENTCYFQARAKRARFFSAPPEHFSPPPERGAGINFRPLLRGGQQNLRGGRKKN